MGRGKTTGVLGLVILTWASSAVADATTDAAALKQFEAGRAAFDKGELSEALNAFTASLHALPSPNTRLYIARCQRGLGKIGSAFTSYRLAAREATDRLNATGEKRYAATRDTAQTEAAEIEKSVPHLTITLPVDTPPAASVQLDEVELPRTALSALDIDPGAHSLKVVAPRRTTFDQRFELGQGEQKTVVVALPRLPTATIQLAFKSKPAGVAVEIDGRPIDPNLVTNVHELDVGAHALVVRAPGYRNFEWKQVLTDGESKKVDVTFQPAAGSTAGDSHGTPKWLFFGVAALSVATLGVGTYFAIDATSRSNDEKAIDPLVRSRTEQDEIRSQATAANVLFIAGAALAAGAGALGFITDWRRGAAPKAGQKVEPFFALSGGGLKGSF